MNRRTFMHLTIASGIAAGVLGPRAWAEEKKSGGMFHRTLGSTGEKVSAIGVGGFHIGRPSEEEGIRIIRTAVDAGINFLDNSWGYFRGNSEVRMGKALRDGYRDKVFLMTKIDARDRQGAADQIDECLKRLQTDRVDLLQFHEMNTREDPDRIFARDGALEAVLAAKKAGKLRYIGFTGHKAPAIHLYTMELAAKNGLRFDAVQMPLNVMDAHYLSFEHEVLPVLNKEKIGVLGMKTFGFGAILKSKVVTARECLHYVLNLPTSSIIVGMQSMDELNQALEAARTFKPMDKTEVAALLARTADAARDGQFEHYKSTPNLDATAKKPKT